MVLKSTPFSIARVMKQRLSDRGEKWGRLRRLQAASKAFFGSLTFKTGWPFRTRPCSGSGDFQISLPLTLKTA
jgi:hypothetical protein